jgi:hypothetical protein
MKENCFRAMFGDGCNRLLRPRPRKYGHTPIGCAPCANEVLNPGPTRSSTGNKRRRRSSYVMNGLSRRSRLIKQRGVLMASVVHPMARTREMHLNRNDIRQASRRKSFLSRGLVSLCDRSRTGRKSLRRSPNFRLAIRPGRFPSARAARATARRIGISVWRSDQWEVPVVVR